MARIPSTVALPQPLTALCTAGHRGTGTAAAPVVKCIRLRLTLSDHQALSRIAERFGMPLSAMVRNLLNGIPLPRSCSERPALGDAVLARELARMRLQLLRAVRALAQGGPATHPVRPHLAAMALEREVLHCVAGLECAITVLLTGAR